jgi:Fe-S cluster assembly protein SufD
MAAPAQKFELAAHLLAARPVPSGEAAWATAARAAAVERLTRMGGPHRRDEYFKFTDPASLVAPETPAAARVAPDGKAAFADSD